MARLLIVEDNLNQQTLYAEELTDDGHDVACATNGPDALVVFKQQQPDLVITDILLPCMTGIEVMECMLAANPNLPIIIHTAYSSPRMDFIAGMARAYVIKSGNLDALKHHIRAVLTPPSIQIEQRPLPEYQS